MYRGRSQVSVSRIIRVQVGILILQSGMLISLRDPIPRCQPKLDIYPILLDHTRLLHTSLLLSNLQCQDIVKLLLIVLHNRLHPLLSNQQCLDILKPLLLIVLHNRLTVFQVKVKVNHIRIHSRILNTNNNLHLATSTANLHILVGGVHTIMHLHSNPELCLSLLTQPLLHILILLPIRVAITGNDNNFLSVLSCSSFCCSQVDGTGRNETSLLYKVLAYIVIHL